VVQIKLTKNVQLLMNRKNAQIPWIFERSRTLTGWLTPPLNPSHYSYAIWLFISSNHLSLTGHGRFSTNKSINTDPLNIYLVHKVFQSLTAEIKSILRPSWLKQDVHDLIPVDRTSSESRRNFFIDEP